MDTNPKRTNSKKKDYAYSFNNKSTDKERTDKRKSSILNLDRLGVLEKPKFAIINIYENSPAKKKVESETFKKFKHGYKKSFVPSMRPTVPKTSTDIRLLTEPNFKNNIEQVSKPKQRFQTEAEQSPSINKLFKTQKSDQKKLKKKPTNDKLSNFKKSITKEITKKVVKKPIPKRDSGVSSEILNSIKMLGNLISSDMSKVQDTAEVRNLNTLLEMTEKTPNKAGRDRDCLKKAFVGSCVKESDSESDSLLFANEEVDAEKRIKKYNLLFDFINNNIKEIGSLVMEQVQEKKPIVIGNILTTTNFNDKSDFSMNDTVREGQDKTESSFLESEESKNEHELTVLEIEPAKANLAKLQILKSTPKPKDILVNTENKMHEDMRSMFISSLNGDFYQDIMDKTLANRGEVSIFDDMEITKLVEETRGQPQSKTNCFVF